MAIEYTELPEPIRLFDFNMQAQGTRENPFYIYDSDQESDILMSSEFEDQTEEDLQWYLKGTAGVIFPEGSIN